MAHNKAQEDKELLLKDICARLPYGVKGIITLNEDKNIFIVKGIFNILFLYDTDYRYLTECCCVESFKPYLRPMSSMTEEEKEELLNRLPKYWSLEIDKLGDLYFDICDASYPDIELLTDIIDWLNAHHFDYRGLIEKGLAIEAPEEMYNIKK